jgi:uncharacterized RDD family membrane protein YckC
MDAAQWRYLRGGSPSEPVSAQKLTELRESGVVADDTLVWRSGMEQWAPFGEAFTAQEGLQACSLCSKTAPLEDVLVVDHTAVCAECKPLYIQSLKEGRQAGSQLFVAGLGMRFLAKILDWIILFAVQGAMYALLLNFMTVGEASPFDPAFSIAQTFLGLGQFLIGAVYVTYFLGAYGATPGKMACGMRVVTAEGEPISYWRAFGRYWAEVLSGLVMYIGYIIAFFDEERRTLHDHICSTRVVES